MTLPEDISSEGASTEAASAAAVAQPEAPPTATVTRQLDLEVVEEVVEAEEEEEEPPLATPQTTQPQPTPAPVWQSVSAQCATGGSQRATAARPATAVTATRVRPANTAGGAAGTAAAAAKAAAAKAAASARVAAKAAQAKQEASPPKPTSPPKIAVGTFGVAAKGSASASVASSTSPSSPPSRIVNAAVARVSPTTTAQALKTAACAHEVAQAAAQMVNDAAANAAATKAASLTFCASSAANLSHLRVAVAQHECDSLYERRKYWYKPVALLGGVAYSIAEGEALIFKIGKRMLAANEGANSQARGKGGFLIYECAARALQAALVRPKGKLAHATKAVLRVTASRPCAPTQSKWPTSAGVWAFEMITPVAIALEQQTWMEDRSLAAMWLPASPPGLCKQCALGEKTCVQVRNHLEMGAPPKKGKKANPPPQLPMCGESKAPPSSLAPTGLGWDQLAANQVNAVEYTVQPGEQEELDFRSFV